MSLKRLKEEAAHLPLVEQRELIAFLVSMQTEQNATFQEHLAAKIDDAHSENWMELNDLQRR